MERRSPDKGLEAPRLLHGFLHAYVSKNNNNFYVEVKVVFPLKVRNRKAGALACHDHQKGHTVRLFAT